MRVHEHADGTLSVFHGPRWLARYDAGGAALPEPVALAAGWGMFAGNAVGFAVSSRCAAAPLRCAPSGDTALADRA